MNNRFIILVTQRDAKPFIRKCLDSILAQTYKNYVVTIMDDCSTDGTWEIVKEYSFYAFRNSIKWKRPCKNFVAGINAFATEKEDIVVMLSGDDWFYSNDVLATLNKVYQEDVWMTYGNFIPSSGKYGPYCVPLKNTKKYRKSGTWVVSHLVTFKKKLWDKIERKDLLYKDGDYPLNSFDCAFLYPMIEMAGLKHIMFIEKVLYVYNDENPVAAEHFDEDPGACLRERQYWMDKPSYVELTEL